MSDLLPGYYVSAIDGELCAFPAGPFQTHEEALAAVDSTKAAWIDKDPRAWFAAWGTCRVRADGEAPPKRVRRVRLPLFVPSASEGRFRVFASRNGTLRTVFAGDETPVGWTELARINLPRKRDLGFDVVHAAYDALLRLYGRVL